MNMVLWTPSDWAAWAQAIGSILAVLAALAVVFLQNHFNKKNEVSKQIDLINRYIHLVISLGGGLREKVNTLSDWAAQGGSAAQNLCFMRVEVEAINNAIQNIPLWEIDTFDEVVYVISIQTQSKALLETIRRAEQLSTQTIGWNREVDIKLSTIKPDLNQKLDKLIKIYEKRITR